MNPIRVAIVEDQPEFLQHLARLVQEEASLALAGTAATGAEALALLERGGADVYLVDLGLPDMDGTRVIREAARCHPDADIMVVTVFGDDAHVVSSIEAGATGYLLKDVTGPELLASIQALRAGGSPISPVIARRLLTRMRPPQPPTEADAHLLSPRETEILQFVAKGMTMDEIGRLLDISSHTVTAHVKKIYRKLAVHSRSEAVYEASRMGILRL